jgi:CheY-like chemotaxis protein
MAIKCPKCSAVIDASPDELGLVTCGQCGARLRSKQPVKVTVTSGPSASSPSLPKIDRNMAAPADVDHVLARIDVRSPDETIRPGALPKAAAPPGGPQTGAVLDMLLTEIRGLKKTQEEILALLRGGALAPPAKGPDQDEEPAPPQASRAAGRYSVLLVDDDARARQDAVAALQPLASVKTAGDGSSALASIAMERPTVIVIELGIGGAMPGHDLLNMIKATMEWVDIPIVLYTREAIADDDEARHSHGVDAIVAKGDGSAKALSARVAEFLKRA